MANNFTLQNFRFANPTTAAQTQFNNTIGLGGADNINKAYSQFLAGPNSDPNATQEFQSAWGPQWDDPSTNADLYHNILGTYIQGGNNLLGQGYTYQSPTRADRMAGQQATYNRYQGVPLNQLYGNAASGSFPNMPTAQGGGFGGGANGGAPPIGAPAGTPSMPTGGGTAGLPGVGNNSYSAPLTDPSAYLDPSMAFTMKQGMDALQNSAAASGNLLSGQTLKNIANYSQGLASTNWQNAMQNAMTDTNRRYGVDNNDRNFAYNAQVGDRDFNNSNAQFLASLGMQGTNANSQLAQSLATLLSGNSVAAGQAQGAGTIGANNALGSSLSQIISQLYGNNILSQLGLGGGTNG